MRFMKWVLVVEDEALIASMIEWLSEMGCEAPSIRSKPGFASGSAGSSRR
jgi:hypothetical protein